MPLTIESEVVKDAQGRIPYRVFQSGGREHYNLRIWLAGPEQELDQVSNVEYLLHPSFRRRLMNATERDDNFAILIWTWGMFAIQATIHYKDGTVEEQEFYLSYDLPEDDGTNYLVRNE